MLALAKESGLPISELVRANERTWRRKIVEIVLAIDLDAQQPHLAGRIERPQGGQQVPAFEERIGFDRAFGEIAPRRSTRLPQMMRLLQEALLRYRLPDCAVTNDLARSRLAVN